MNYNNGLGNLSISNEHPISYNNRRHLFIMYSLIGPRSFLPGRCASTAMASLRSIRTVLHTTKLPQCQYRGIATRDMTAGDLKRLKVNQARMMETLHYTCEFGKGRRWGR